LFAVIDAQTGDVLDNGYRSVEEAAKLGKKKRLSILLTETVKS